jgi:hypothetical protein
VCLGVEETLASLLICRSDGGSLETPAAIAGHAEPAEFKADPREEVEVGQGGQPEGARELGGLLRFRLWLGSHPNREGIR